MKLKAHLRRAVGLAVLATAVATVPAFTSTPVGAAGELQAGGEFHALTPTRIYDSRPVSPVNEPSPGAKPMSTGNSTNGSVFDIGLLGLGGVPVSATEVLAVAVSITVVDPTRQGNLGAYPTGQFSYTSIVNFSAGQTVPNLAIVRAGTGGKLTIRLEAVGGGTANVLVDVFGYFTSSTSTDRGARLITTDPARILDTRNGANPDTPVGAGAGNQRAVTIRGAVAEGTSNVVVPNNSNIVGVLINVTAVLPTAGGFVSVLPQAAGGVPSSSNLNFAPGAVKANLVMVPIGDDGKIYLYNANGNTNLIVDVVGYLENGRDVNTRKGRVVPLTAPYRVFNTADPAFGQVPLGPGQAEDWSFTNFAASVTINAVAVGNQEGLIGNLTALQLVRQSPSVPASGYLTMYPSDVARPNVSNLNPVETVETPNMAIVKYGANMLARAYNGSLTGKVHYLLDVSAVILAD